MLLAIGQHSPDGAPIARVHHRLDLVLAQPTELGKSQGILLNVSLTGHDPRLHEIRRFGHVFGVGGGGGGGGGVDVGGGTIWEGVMADGSMTDHPGVQIDAPRLHDDPFGGLIDHQLDEMARDGDDSFQT